ncbi:hypothetical protein CPB84DRAFT_237104 [Gymnopilus junonius]|uniref:Uncharacterized protein n=1 Tax=Gymnopilus junonius TaxID=109634 RepID=A0A9P5TIH4_GYMJU|nr:hypothetical protein CPB84DRAFT_237104 [Gymnopilus junonius]
MVSKQNSVDPPPYEVRTSGNESESKARPSLPTSARASGSSSIWVPWKPFTSRRKTKNNVRSRLRQMIIDMELEPAGSGNNPSSTQIKHTTAESVEAILCSCEDACAEKQYTARSIHRGAFTALLGHPQAVFFQINQKKLHRFRQRSIMRHPVHAILFSTMQWLSAGQYFI